MEQAQSRPKGLVAMALGSCLALSCQGPVPDVSTEAAAALERVGSLLVATSSATVHPRAAAPLCASSLQFSRTLGAGQEGPLESLAMVEDGADPQNGRDDDGDGLVDEQLLVWTRRVGSPEPESVVLCEGLTAFSAGEVPNGMDDNGNGLIDETGAYFSFDGDTLIYSLSVPGEGGAPTAFEGRALLAKGP